MIINNGFLHLILGPMFAGKSTKLLEILNDLRSFELNKVLNLDWINLNIILSVGSILCLVLAFLFQIFGCFCSNNKFIRGFIATLNMLSSKCLIKRFDK
jgi:hypothetical protein